MPKLPEELEKLLAEYAGAGTSDRLWHQGYLKLDDPGSEPWVDALDAIYTRNDATLLRDLIKAGAKPPAEMLPHIDELFKQKIFRNRHAGKPPVPSYMENPTEYGMAILVKTVRDLAKSEGITVEAAIERVGGDDREKLANAVYGRRGSSRKKPA